MIPADPRGNMLIEELSRRATLGSPRSASPDLGEPRMPDVGASFIVREGPAADGPWLTDFDLASELDLGVMAMGPIGDGVDPDLARLTGDKDMREEGEPVR